MRVLATKKDQVKLDLIDRKIIYLLSINARFSYSTIAKHVSLSREAVKQRISRLIKKEVILGFQTAINNKLLDFYSYHVFLRLKNPQQKNEDKIISELLGDQDVNALLQYEGEFDFEVSYLLKDINEFNQKIKELTSKEISNYTFCILLDSFVSQTYPKCLHQLELKLKNIRHDGSFFGEFNKKNEEKFNLDKTDYALLKILSDDARISMTNLSSKLKVSVDAVIYRIKKLIRSRIILDFRPIINYASLGFSVYCMFFRLKRLTPEKEREFNYYLKVNDHILWSANCLGPFNNISYLIVKDTFDYHDVVKEIREKFFDILDSYSSMLAFAEYKYTFFTKKK